MTRIFAGLGMLVGMGLSGCAAHHLVTPPSERASADTLFQRVYVLDTDHGTRVGPVDVLVSGDRIAQVSETAIEPANQTEIVDGNGRTLMPGLTDAHVHVGGGTGAPPWKFAPPKVGEQLEAYLFAGVTTVVSATDPPGGARLDAALVSSRRSGPRMVRASRAFTATDGHPEPMLRLAVPWPFTGLAIAGTRVEAPDEARGLERLDREIDRRKPELIKLIYDALPEDTPKLSRELMRKLVARANERGVKPVVHVGSAAEAVEAVEAGAWLIMHTPWDDRFSEDDLELLAQAKVPFVTTGRINDVLLTLSEGWDDWTELEKELVPEETRRAMNSRPKNWSPGGFDEMLSKLPEMAANQHANILALHEAGVPLIAGTDSGVPGMFHGTSLHEELKLLVDIGIPPADVLRMATVAPGDLLYPNDARGRVEVDQVADLVLVNGNPLEDITATQDIEGVWQAGQRVR